MAHCNYFGGDKDQEGIMQMLSTSRSYLKQQAREDIARDKEKQADGQDVELDEHELVRRHHRAAWISIQLQLYWSLFLGFSFLIAIRIVTWMIAKEVDRQVVDTAAFIFIVCQGSIFDLLVKIVSLRILLAQSLVKDSIGVLVTLLFSMLVTIILGGVIQQNILLVATYVSSTGL